MPYFSHTHRVAIDCRIYIELCIGNTQREFVHCNMKFYEHKTNSECNYNVNENLVTHKVNEFL